MEDLFPEIPAEFESLSDEELAEFVESMVSAVRSATTNPTEYVSEEVSSADLLAATREGITALQAARAELSAREVVEEVPAELSDEERDEFAALAAEVEEPEAEEVEETEEAETAAVEETETAEIEEPEAVVAAAKPPARRRLPKPSQSRRPVEGTKELVPLVASAGAPGMDPGEEFPSMEAIAAAMQGRRRNFGIIAEGTRGEKIPIARTSWSHLYPEERKLTGDEHRNETLIADATNSSLIRKEMDKRREGALVASGGLCAPVTPYYQLQMISDAGRPVRAALPAFNADRGGIRFARPASLADVDTAVGVRTAAQDGVGGTTAEKTCQVVDCPPFEESDVQIIFHCLQFGNLGARTFPERVTQWNSLTLAAHARLAESELLTGIDVASTQVTAADIGLGASATLFSQIMAAASAMRSRHRMAADSVLRIQLPWWSVYLIVSDVFRGQFQRFDVDQARVVALLRSIDVEPSFYIDEADGRSQIFGTQSDGALLPFPSTVVWYLYPEGSFLYVDGGVLELGLVRDSVLNRTNDFQIFGETFENVAFVGVESLAVETSTCDSGTVSLPTEIDCPISYATS